MGVLASVKEHSRGTQIAAAIAVLVVLIYINRGTFSGSSLPTPKAYFTTDDGATQFVDAADKLPPFDHDGKPAYRITMYSADGGKTKVAGYMERYTPQGKSRMEALRQNLPSAAPHAPVAPDLSGTEVKLPGVGHPWVNRASGLQAINIINPLASAKLASNYEEVLP